MADLKNEDLLSLARLSRIALSKEEKDTLLPELWQMLALTVCLKDEEGGKTAKLLQTPFVTRNDEAKPWRQSDRLLACAPKEKDGFFLVSFEKEEGS